MSYHVDNFQAQNGENLMFKVKFYLEGQCWLPHKNLRTLNKVLHTFGQDLVILVWMGPELSHRKASDWYTHTQRWTHTDTGNDNNQRPKLASGEDYTADANNSYNNAIPAKHTFRHNKHCKYISEIFEMFAE